MRIWSLHPKYLDCKGLVALWRETLLAKHVLEGKTTGYRTHPQLIRFKQAHSPVDCINHYLAQVYKEATERGYNFNRDKINWDINPSTLTVSHGQMKYETTHLLKKLRLRSSKSYLELVKETNVEPHPMLIVVEGGIEEWEQVKNK